VLLAVPFNFELHLPLAEVPLEGQRSFLLAWLDYAYEQRGRSRLRARFDNTSKQSRCHGGVFIDGLRMGRSGLRLSLTGVEMSWAGIGCLGCPYERVCGRSRMM
jgi:hypothetical protein